MIRSMSNLFRAIFGPMPLKEFKDYEEYWEQRKPESSSGTPTTETLHRHLSIGKKIPPGSSVLDIGCGRGDFLRHLKGLDLDFTLYGLDLSSTAIKELQKSGIEGSSIDPSRKLREQVQGNFDYIVMMEVIEHVHEAEEFVRQTLDFSPKSVFITIPNAGYIIHR